MQLTILRKKTHVASELFFFYVDQFRLWAGPILYGQDQF